MLFLPWSRLVQPLLRNQSRSIRRRKVRQIPLAALESLESRALMAAVMSAAEQVTAARIAQLGYLQFNTLRPNEVPYLTPAQMSGIATNAVLISIPADARTALSADQVRMLKVANSGINGLTPAQVGALTVGQIQSLKVADCPLLQPGQIASLTTAQVGTINTEKLLRAIPAGIRAELTSTQIQALPVKITGLALLTDSQVEALTVAQIQLLAAKDVAQLMPWQTASLKPAQLAAYAGTTENAAALATKPVGGKTVGQIRGMKYWDFDELSPEQVPYLSTAQIASISGDWAFEQLSDAARGALTPGQLKALMVGSVGLDGLTPSQIGNLSPFQIQALSYWSFPDLPMSQVTKLSGDQLATVTSGWWFEQIPAAVRATLTPAQVKALVVREIGLDGLTATQIGQLNPNQIRSLQYWDFHLLGKGQTPQLSSAQMTTIPNEWWFGRWSAEARGALKAAQVQGLNVAEVGISLLTVAQVKQLSTAQIQQLTYDQFQSLNKTQTPLLTVGQIATIPNGWWFERMSVPARAALTTTQVQALNVVEIGLGGLTVAQRGMLTQAQVQSLGQDDFRYLTASQTPWLTTTQMATIDSGWWFDQIPAAARAVFSGDQVRALDIEDVGIGGLTDSQIDALLPEQIQEVWTWQFHEITPRQAPNMSLAQLASLENSWTFNAMRDDSRAALTQPQIQALPINMVGIAALTDPQIDWLTLDQIQDVTYDEFDDLHLSQIDDLTTDQIASIASCWWFEAIPEDVRAGLTVTQVQALNTANVSVDHLTSTQRDVLTVVQIQAINDAWTFQFLNPEQVTHLTTDQMTLFNNEWEFHQMSDAAQAALSREQMLAMPESVMAAMLDLDAGMFSPSGAAVEEEHDHDHDTPAPTPTPTTGPHPDDPAKRDEHLALFSLVPREAATFVTIASGNWNNPAVWKDGVVPIGGAQVLVSAGNTVTFNVVQTNALKWVRVDGTLTFATNLDTQLLVDTVVVDPAGALIIGTDEAPIQSGVAARIVIADNGKAIDKTWDPLQLSRGVISHGTTEMQGETVTPFVSLNGVRRGATQLTLDSVPTNWRIGDRLVLTGTTSDISAKQDEELKLVAINGNVVTIDNNDTLAGNQGLDFNHTPPERYNGLGLKVYLSDMNRNVVIMSQNPITERRGHVMFMHSPKVEVDNVGFYGLGRTDKRNPINDPVFDAAGHLLPTTGLNVRGRYAVHFHRQGADGTKTPAEISGSVVVDSPGWGFVNHDSNVNMVNNVAFNVQGASFVTEFGSEIGSMVGNLSIRNEGSGDGLEDRQDIFDFGHGGNGFWLQGAGVEVVNNIAASSAEAAFIFFTTSSEADFDAKNLTDPSLAGGHATVPVGVVPFKRVDGNIAFAAESGLETWFHLTHVPGGQSYIDNFTSWNTDRGMFNPYTGHTTIRNARVLGHSGFWGTGFDRNNVTNNMTYENVRADGWEVGISVPVNRATVIRDGVFHNVRDIEVNTTEDTTRTVDIVGDPQFTSLTAQQLGDREKFDIYLDGEIELKNRDLETYFSPDIVRLGTVKFNNHQVYFDKQAASYIAFPASDTATLTWLPPEIVGQTNQQLWDAFGLAPGGAIAPADAVHVAGINGLVGSRTTYLPTLELRSDKYTNQPNNYTLSYENARGDEIAEQSKSPIREGWNLLTRQVDGNKRTFFVYGDTKAPEFILNTDRTDLRVNPQGLQFGIVIYGTVRDDSFGEMHFRREFKDLQTRPILTDSLGKKYINLTFNIHDLAGNTTSVSLKVYLDPTVPIVPGTGQRDLPPRDVPRTLAELLAYYYLTGERAI